MTEDNPVGSPEPTGPPHHAIINFLKSAPQEVAPWANEQIAALQASASSDANVVGQQDHGDVSGESIEDSEQRADGSMQASAESTGPATNTSVPAAAADPADPNELALAELGEDNDDEPLFRRNARKKSKRIRKAARGAEPAAIRDFAPGEVSGPSTVTLAAGAAGAGAISGAAGAAGAGTDGGAGAIADAPEGFAAEPHGKKDRLFPLLIAAALVFGVAFGIYMIGKPDVQVDPTTEQTMPEGHPDIGGMGGASGAQELARIQELYATLEDDPEDNRARLELGVLLMSQRDIDGAEEQWLAALDNDPELIEAHYNLGFLYLSKEPPQEDLAVESWERVVELEPDSDLAQNVEMHLNALVNQQDGTPTDGTEPSAGPDEETSNENPVDEESTSPGGE